MTGNDLQLPAFSDAHQRVGLTLLVLYLVQALLGPFIHFFKFPVFRGHRPPQNYLHIAIGITIFILAAYQVRSDSRHFKISILEGRTIEGLSNYIALSANDL
jgi:hypothetical protein